MPPPPSRWTVSYEPNLVPVRSFICGPRMAVYLETTPNRSTSRKGLNITSLAPDARNRSWLLAVASTLAITIGMPGLIRLILRVASRPSIPGIATSITITSGEWTSAIDIPSNPSRR